LDVEVPFHRTCREMMRGTRIKYRHIRCNWGEELGVCRRNTDFFDCCKVVIVTPTVNAKFTWRIIYLLKLGTAGLATLNMSDSQFSQTLVKSQNSARLSLNDCEKAVNLF